MFRKILNTFVAAAGLALATSVGAVSMTFDGAGDSLVTKYLFNIDGAVVNVTVTYTMTAITGGQADFDVSLVNSSSGAGQIRLVSFGVDVVAPPLTGASTTSSLPTAGEWEAVNGAILPAFQHVDLCSFSGNNCPGGSNDGIGKGDPPESFHLILTGNFASATPSPSVTFTSPFPGKFQSVGVAGKSYEIDACANPTDCQPGTPRDTPLPEPGTLALFALGLWGVFASRRRSLD